MEKWRLRPRRAARSVRVVGVLVAFLVGMAALAAPASAAPVIPLNWKVTASTHLKKLGLDVNVPGGTFVGGIDLADGSLTGNLTLPPASIKLSLGPIPLVDATFAMTPAGPISGHVDFATLQVTATATFSISITRAQALGLPVNLVGNRCTTSKNITVTMSGKADLAAGSTFTGTYTIPPLKTCGLLTPALNLVVPGAGNTFSATFTP